MKLKKKTCKMAPRNAPTKLKKMGPKIPFNGDDGCDKGEFKSPFCFRGSPFTFCDFEQFF
jgi:hypothetical protein